MPSNWEDKYPAKWLIAHIFSAAPDLRYTKKYSDMKK
jgi:hypothetical protein